MAMYIQPLKYIVASLCILGFNSAAQDVKPGFLVDITKGCKVWSKSPQDRKVEWSGRCKYGYAEGSGKAMFYEIDVFLGDFIGEMKKGKFSGRGTANFANGQKLEGEWKAGELHGRGTWRLSDGSTYDGEWREGMPDGHGAFNYSDGRRYVGDLRAGKLHGKGLLDAGDGEKYIGDFKNGNFHGRGVLTLPNGVMFEGDFKDGKVNGRGISRSPEGDKYEGEWRDGKPNGRGINMAADGKRQEGIWENGIFIEAEIIGSSNPKKYSEKNLNKNRDWSDQNKSTEERPTQNRQTSDALQYRDTDPFSMQVTNTLPASDGSFFINVRALSATKSLLVNGEEYGSSSDGIYKIKKYVKVGQESVFTVAATDVKGNADEKKITVSRTVGEHHVSAAQLNPTKIKRQPSRDAVAIIIGIADYKNLPRADYANDDAKLFYDYAIRALGVAPNNIRLLVDLDADRGDIYRTFKTWLPSKVRSNTDVYVFYSGHGLPTENGDSLYLLLPRADPEFISRSSISFQEISSDIQAAKPKSVTVFLDACYSGQTRSGDALLTSARPVALKVEKRIFPDSFTVISASQADQISSSSPDLKHGIFSYYLMRGMEGDADVNRDGKITAGEMHTYLMEQVARQAGMMNRKQEPQLTGDANRVLVGR